MMLLYYMPSSTHFTKRDKFVTVSFSNEHFHSWQDYQIVDGVCVLAYTTGVSNIGTSAERGDSYYRSIITTEGPGIQALDILI